jgi:hypothetical protein
MLRAIQRMLQWMGRRISKNRTHDANALFPAIIAREVRQVASSNRLARSYSAAEGGTPHLLHRGCNFLHYVAARGVLPDERDRISRLQGPERGV